jgi:hypothetical protein
VFKSVVSCVLNMRCKHQYCRRVKCGWQQLHSSCHCLLLRSEGPVEPDELIARLQTVVTANEVALIAARAER